MSDIKKQLILVVDDDADFREIMTSKLLSSGFAVQQAVNGAEALVSLKTLKPDLILLDMQMPIMNGAETMDKIKSDPALRDLKVVFLTGLGEKMEAGEEIDKQIAGQVGALDYIRKTDDLDAIMAHVSAILIKKAEN